MENHKHKKLMKRLALGALIIATAAMTIACGKKKGSNNNNLNRGRLIGGSFLGGPGYNGIGTVASLGAGGDYNGEFLIVLAASTDPNGRSGQAVVDGELHVFAPLVCPYDSRIALGPGTYQLYPFEGRPAGFYNGLISKAVLIAEGPSGQAIVTVPEAASFSSRVCGVSGMAGFMYIEEINRVGCGLSLSFTDRIDQRICGY